MSVLNNIGALTGVRQLGLTQTGLNDTIQRLTTTKRINKASDDAAGLSIAVKLGADVKIMAQGQRNANDGIRYLGVADGVIDEVIDKLTRAATLAQQSATGTVDDTGRSALDAEFKKIQGFIQQINDNTKFNGTQVFNSTLSVAVGGYSAVGIAVDAIGTTALSLTGDLTSAANAVTAQTQIVSALSTVATVRGNIGATMAQLTATSNALGIAMENTTAAYSQIMDADLAQEVVSLTKFQILNQSGTSALGQANNSSQSVLSLLR
jgi:flagellin